MDRRYISTFLTPAARKKLQNQTVYAISQTVTDFFWDTAPSCGLEVRDGQQEMAFEILDAIRQFQHIAVEAGVGIGKSFAYLVPLLLYNQHTHRPVAIATSTIALQEQLLGDVERLSGMLGIQPDVLLAKGQSHYICQKRAEAYFLSPKGRGMVSLKIHIDQGYQDRRTFPVSVPSSVWDEINVLRFSRRTCQTCQHRESCCYYQLRSDLKYTSGVILCNQDLLTAHLFHLDRGQEGLLSNALQLVVIDEAHNLEGKVRSATTERFGQRQLISLIENGLKAVRNTEAQNFLREEANQALHSARGLYANLDRQIQQQISASDQDLKYAERFFFNQSPSSTQLIRNFARDLTRLSNSIQVYSSMDYRRQDNSTAADDLEAAAQSFSLLVAEFSKRLIWLERRGGTAELVFCPKNTSGIIRRLYFQGQVQSIMTSATLTSAQGGVVEEQYAYFLQNTGFPTGRDGVLSEPKASPFPYDEHALIYFCNDLPHPTRDHDGFIKQGVERLIQVLNISHGKALVLFTAKTDMEEVYAALKGRDLPYQILIQQDGSSQERVLQTFKDDTDSVLLGTGSYWEGISIEGKSLSHVVIFRLPFPVPDPIIEYKASLAKDPLMDVRVPEMVIKLKQGIGRLIRNFTDTGLISIIDSRLRDDPPERYHDVAWNSLPIHNRTTDLQEAEQFYQKTCQ